MKASLVLLVWPLAGCVDTGRTPILKITNFEQGLTRPDGKGGWEIYEKGDHFKLVINKSCTVAGEQRPCMRHAAGETHLKGRHGRVFWHGYSVPDGNTNPHTTSMRCLHGGTEVLAYDFTVTEQPFAARQWLPR